MSYPFKAFPVPKSKPRKLGAKLALAGGIALLAAGSLSAAEVYTRAEITIGGPNAQITLGKTWETGYHDCDHDCDRTEKDDYVIEKRVILSDDDCHHHEHGKVVVYRNHPRCDREVRVIRHVEYDCQHNEYGKVVVYRNHSRCDRDVRVIRHIEPVRYERDIRIIRENVPTRCERGTRVVEVVRDQPRMDRVTVIRRPEHRVIVVNTPDRNCDKKVIVTHRDRGHSDHKDWKDNRGHDGHKEYKDRGHNGHNGHNDRGNGGDKIKKDHTDNGRHYGEKYEKSGHSSRRDSDDRPTRLSRERGQRGRML